MPSTNGNVLNLFRKSTLIILCFYMSYSPWTMRPDWDKVCVRLVRPSRPSVMRFKLVEASQRRSFKVDPESQCMPLISQLLSPEAFHAQLISVAQFSLQITHTDL